MSTFWPYPESRTVSPGADTRVAPVLPYPRPHGADAGAWLARLRTEFPRWGILFDPWRSTWIAVRGRHEIEVASTAIALRDALAAPRLR